MHWLLRHAKKKEAEKNEEFNIEKKIDSLFEKENDIYYRAMPFMNELLIKYGSECIDNREEYDPKHTDRSFDNFEAIMKEDAITLIDPKLELLKNLPDSAQKNIKIKYLKIEKYALMRLYYTVALTNKIDIQEIYNEYLELEDQIKELEK